MRNRRVLFWVILVVTLVLDQALKLWIRGEFHKGRQDTIIPGLLDLTYVENEGIAFGLFQGAGVFLSPVAILIAVIAAVYSMRHPREGAWTHVAMALLASGALGNLYDRLAHGKVTDMFQLTAVEFPVFNIADACITLAAGILILKWAKEAFVPAEAPAEPVSEGRSEGEEHYALEPQHASISRTSDSPDTEVIDAEYERVPRDLDQQTALEPAPEELFPEADTEPLPGDSDADKDSHVQ